MMGQIINKDDFFDIPGCGGRYQVSHYGEFYSVPKFWVTANGGMRNHNGKILKKIKGKDGYLRVKLTVNGVSMTKLAHRIVAETFIQNPLNLPEVNHLDGDKCNICSYNLEWSTHKNNIIHAHKTGLASTRAAVLATSLIIENCETGEIYQSAEKAAISNGISRTHLLNMLNGKYRNNTNLKYHVSTDRK